jgi:AcrR family transcriptional regulator
LLELAYRYVLDHGLAHVSLRPLAAAIGSSPRVLLFLFGSKDGLVRALLARARQDELELLQRLHDQGRGDCAIGLDLVVAEVWRWLVVDSHRPLLTLWAEGYGRSLVDAGGPWADFGRATVADWLDVLRSSQAPDERDTPAGEARRTLALAVLRGALLDLLATGDAERTTAAVEQHVHALRASRSVDQ